jgi:PAS domain S-box-containing protein
MTTSHRHPSGAGEPPALRDPGLGAERILAQISSSVKDFAIIVLTPDGRVAHWNEGAERLFGYEAGEIHGRDAGILFPPEDRAKGIPEEELRRARTEGRAEDDSRLQRKDGSRFWASGVCTSVRGTSDDLEGFVKILRDQSSRKALEDELRRVNASLEQRVRERTADLEDALKEMAAFSYSIAHDLKAPLRAMTGLAEALTEDFGDALGETGHEYTRRIRDAATNMNQMIEDLLTYSRLTRAEILCHPLDPGGVLDDVLRRLAADIQGRGAEISVERPLPTVLGHEITLGQVFTNLISNALKFVAPGVRPRIRVFGEEREDSIRICVEDNGIGIAPEYQKKIFGIFERLNPALEYPGTGIGLAIVNRAIERMKGRVGVDSLNGKGSRFWIELRKAAT